MYAFTSRPLVSRTRATLRSAEFGFFGVAVKTRRQTPRRCGERIRSGDAERVGSGRRPLRISCWMVGTRAPVAKTPIPCAPPSVSKGPEATAPREPPSALPGVDRRKAVDSRKPAHLSELPTRVNARERRPHAPRKRPGALAWAPRREPRCVRRARPGSGLEGAAARARRGHHALRDPRIAASPHGRLRRRGRLDLRALGRLDLDPDPLVAGHPGPRRDEPPHDHVLLQ